MHQFLRSAKTYALAGFDKGPLNQHCVFGHRVQQCGIIRSGSQTQLFRVRAPGTQRLARGYPGIGKQLLQLSAGKRRLLIFDHGKLNSRGFLQDRECFARRTASGIMPNRCLHSCVSYFAIRRSYQLPEFIQVCENSHCICERFAIEGSQLRLRIVRNSDS
jgi:hypothetical protein